MCPEESLLSAYFDNEIDPQYSSVMSEHIHGCTVCRQKLEQFKELGTFLHSQDDLNDMEDARERIWDEIQSRRETSPGLLHRRVLIPLPLAAAAVFAFFFLAGVMVTGLVSKPASPVIVQNDSQSSKLTSMQLEEIIKLLSEKEDKSVLASTLPEDQFVFELGEAVSYTESEFKRSFNP